MLDEITLVAVAENAKRHDVIGHGGENRPQTAARSSMLDYPAFRLAQGIPSRHRDRVMAVYELQKVVHNEEEIVPRERALVPLQSHGGGFGATDPPFIDLPLGPGG